MGVCMQKVVIFFVVAGALLLAAGAAEANKSSVAIESPVSFNQNGKAVLKMTVSHSGNNFMHHTQ
jgi:hypothetical protein